MKEDIMLLSYGPKVLCPYHRIHYLNYKRRWLRAIKAASCRFLNTVNSRMYTRIVENIKFRNVMLCYVMLCYVHISFLVHFLLILPKY